MQKKNNHKIKLISIAGPTASGKTALGIYLANKFKGEIVSADSRQVYKYMDIGTAKDLKEYGKIKYHCIDIIDPKNNFNLAKYIKKAKKSILEINKKNKTPLLVGGTGLYINAVTENYILNNEKINEKLRKELEQKPKEALQKLVLQVCKKNKIDNPLNNSDFNNPYRLIRFIEKASTGAQCISPIKTTSDYENLIIGLEFNKETLKDKVETRVDKRLEYEDMIKEVWNLHYKHKVSWKKIISFGLEYKEIGTFLYKIKNQIKNNRMLNNSYLKDNFKKDYLLMRSNLITGTMQFAKKQMTWFKKNKNIIWITGSKEKIYKTAENLVKNFIK